MNTKTLIITLVIVAVIALVIANLDKAKAKVRVLAGSIFKGGPAPAGLPEPLPSTYNPAIPLNMNVTLLKGTYHANEVVELQNMLIAMGYNIGSRDGRPDGQFGPATEAALKAVTDRYSITLTDFINNYYNKR